MIATAHLRLDMIHGELVGLELLTAVHASEVVAFEDPVTSQ